MTKELLIDAVGYVDESYIASFHKMDLELAKKKNTRKRRNLRTILISAAALMLVIALLTVSLPVAYIINYQEINAYVIETVDRVLFPLDSEDGDPDEQTLQINWQNWDMTEAVFEALGAGTEHSLIERMQGENSGLIGEVMTNIGAFLEKLYQYYLEHKEEFDQVIGEIEGDFETEDETVTEGESEELPPLAPGVIRVDSQQVRYQLSDDGTRFVVLGRTEEAKESDAEFKLVIPQSIEGIPVKKIEKNAFYMENLTEVILPEGLITIGARAFAYTPLTHVVLPESLTTLGEEAFRTTNLQELVIPPMVQHVPGSMCYGNKQLKRVTFMGSVIIGGRAFSGCESLESVEFKHEYIQISTQAFENSGLGVIHYAGTQEKWKTLSIDAYAFDSNSEIRIICSDDTFTEKQPE